MTRSSEDCSKTLRRTSTSKRGLTSTLEQTEAIGIDDGPFSFPKTAGSETSAPIVAVLLHGSHLVRVRLGRIKVDGMDATVQALKLLRRIPRRPVFMSGVTYGGFNIIDPKTIHRHVKVPVIVVTGTKPSNRAVKAALVKHFPDWKRRWEIIDALGPVRSTRTVKAEPPIFYGAFGCSNEEARSLIRKFCMVSRIPEPIRVAGMVARQFSSGTTTETIRASY